MATAAARARAKVRLRPMMRILFMEVHLLSLLILNPLSVCFLTSEVEEF
jgi:hypothetical protein